MRFHSEGYIIIGITAIIMSLINLIIGLMAPDFFPYIFPVSILLFILILQFFRVPDRIIPKDKKGFISPADGKIIYIGTEQEDEYFKDQRLKVSIFMSVFNVHLNRVPLDGQIVYQKYHPGKYLLAFHPKSSLLNERNTIVIRDGQGNEVLIRQIAGGLARRIRSYVSEGMQVNQGQELGFIKFGSRVDIYFPIGTPLNVITGQKVYGNKTFIY